MKKIHVDASVSYDILVGSGLLDHAGEELLKVTGMVSVMLVSDDTVYGLYGKRVRESFEKCGIRVSEFVFPHGEKSKNLDTYTQLLEAMCMAHMTRSDVVAALGGGVTGDMAGFAAATYQRGIRFIQLPTTLLAAVDSSVGGKTAVDLKSGKNQVGAFHQPSLVLCDIDTLDTLPDEEYRCGCAEVIKYGVIGDRDFFDQLAAKEIKEQAEEVIAHCVEMKRDVVMRDEFDHGDRMLLNFGHTFGHAAEACSAFSILHGQGVAMGMAVMVRSACKRGFCTEETVHAIENILKQYKLPDQIRYSLDQMTAAMMTDKKMAGKKMRIIVPDAIGTCHIETIAAEDLAAWLKDGGIQ